MDRFCQQCGAEVAANGQCPKCNPQSASAPQQSPYPQQPQEYPAPQQQQQQQPPYPPQQPPYPPQQPAYQPQQPQQPNQNVEAAKQAAQQVMPFAQSYLNNPKEASRGLLHSDNTALAIMLVLVHVLAASLSFFMPYGKFVTSFQEVLDSYVWSQGVDLELSFIGCIMGATVLTLGFVVISFAVLFAVTKILKEERTYLELFRLVAANTLPMTASHLLFAVITLLFDKIFWIGVLYQFQRYLWVVLILVSVIDLLDISLDGLAPFLLAVLLTFGSFALEQSYVYSNFTVMQNCQTSEGSFKEMIDELGVDIGEAYREQLKEAMDLEYDFLAEGIYDLF